MSIFAQHPGRAELEFGDFSMNEFLDVLRYSSAAKARQMIESLTPTQRATLRQAIA